MTDRVGGTTPAWGETEPEPLRWSSGAWSLELRGDEIADVRFEGDVVLRMVRAVARDRDWNTVPALVDTVDAGDTSLVVSLRLAGLGADFATTLRVDARPDGLTVAMTAHARAAFDRNRLGLVVLHPPTVAGNPLAVITSSGDRIERTFPQSISPHQPALQIARLEWTEGGLRSSLDFVGDEFEMEDQRNWTDASFKTYSTPLSLPFPVHVAVGETIEQSISLRTTRVAAHPGVVTLGAVGFSASGRAVPAIGLGASTAPGDSIAQRLPADHLLVELESRDRAWPAALARAVLEAGDLPLDVRIVVTHADEIAPVLDAIAPLSLLRLGVFSTRTQVSEPDLWNALVAGTAQRGIQAHLVGGARSHFTELNRTHARLAEVPELTFSITPQMHAIEQAQLIESIAMQRLVATDAVRIADGRPVHVGPVTLRSRYNAVATTSGPVADRDDLELGYGAALVVGATDARQSSTALAAWTIASAAALAIPGVASISYFETWGPRGVRGFPVGEALEWLHEIAGAPLLEGGGPLPAGVWALGARTPAGSVLLLANLRSEPVDVDLGAPFAVTQRLEALSAVRLTRE